MGRKTCCFHLPLCWFQWVLICAAPTLADYSVLHCTPPNPQRPSWAVVIWRNTSFSLIHRLMRGTAAHLLTKNLYLWLVIQSQPGSPFLPYQYFQESPLTVFVTSLQHVSLLSLLVLPLSSSCPAALPSESTKTDLCSDRHKTETILGCGQR